MHIFHSLILKAVLLLAGYTAIAQQTYHEYHNQIIASEQLIAEGKYDTAIKKLDSLFAGYDFVFKRDCKMAAELCSYTKNVELGLKFVKRGMQLGWTLKEIKKQKNLRLLLEDPQWNVLQPQYEKLHNEYLKKLNQSVRDQIHSMFKKDQCKALGAFLRIGEKAQKRYAEKKFAPHSEKQMAELDTVIEQFGYPEEQLIGNNMWASVILSHHNSISKAYNSGDTLYINLRPKLLEAIALGALSPYVFATIEDWRTVSLHQYNMTTYGYLGNILNQKELETVNKNRSKIGIRSIKLRNALLDVEQKTGMNLHIKKDWRKGKISVSD